MPRSRQHDRQGFSLLVVPADADESAAIRVPAWALSGLMFLVLVSLLGLAGFGASYYVQARRLAERVEAVGPDPRTRELQQAILDQQGRVRSLVTDYDGLTRQIDEYQGRMDAEIERLQLQVRELDRLAAELRRLLGAPAAEPAPAPTPQSLTQPRAPVARAEGRGSHLQLRPQDVAFPPVDKDPYHAALRLAVLRTQVSTQTVALRSLRAEVAARQAAEHEAAERARLEADAAREAAVAAARAQAEAEEAAAREAARKAAEAAARRTVSADSALAQLDRQVAGLIDRLREGAPIAPQPQQVLMAPLPKEGPGAPNRWPLRLPVTSPFGYRTFRGGLDWHTGVDLAVDLHTEVRSTQAGVVVFAGWQGGYGWCVEVGHGQGYSTLYAHLSRVLVDAGDRVAVDGVLGLSGTSGNSTGPHLHYEIRLNGKAVDPAPHLP